MTAEERVKKVCPDAVLHSSDGFHKVFAVYESAAHDTRRLSQNIRCRWAWADAWRALNST